MKKFFGILFLIIGICAIGMGISALTDLAAKNKSLEMQIQNEFDDNYMERNNEQKAIGLVLVGVGTIFIILGVVMIASKSKTKHAASQQIQPADLPIPLISNNSNHSLQNSKIDDMLSQIERLGKLKDQGLITEEEFQDQKKKCFT